MPEKLRVRLLEEIFAETEAAQAGSCPLPEPGRGAPSIEHAEILTIDEQPENYNYDAADNNAERKRFEEVVQKALEAGEISQEEANRILAAELN